MSVIAGAGHRVATLLSFILTVEDNMLSVENSVWLQVFDPDLLGVVEDAASFDAHCAGSWVEKQKGVKCHTHFVQWKNNMTEQMYQYSFKVALHHANLVM